MSEQARIRETFDRLADEYDDLKLRVIPGYRQVQNLALRYATTKPRPRVLELGCGTGVVSHLPTYQGSSRQLGMVLIAVKSAVRQTRKTHTWTHAANLRLCRV